MDISLHNITKIGIFKDKEGCYDSKLTKIFFTDDKGNQIEVSVFSDNELEFTNVDRLGFEE